MKDGLCAGLNKITEATEPDYTCGKDYWGSGHSFVIEDFYRCIRSGETFPTGPEEAMKTTRLLEKAYTQHSAQRRRSE